MNQEMWERAVEFHGHECPGLAIGVRACEAAIDRLNIQMSTDEEIVCVTENDACGVDAVQAILGCSIGKGNLVYRGTGKHAFSFFNRKTGESVRVYLKANNTGNLPRKQWKEKLLNMPIEEVFEFSKPKFTAPKKAKIFTTVNCEICGEGAPEHKIRLQDGKKVCLDCFEPYDRGW